MVALILSSNVRKALDEALHAIAYDDVGMQLIGAERARVLTRVDPAHDVAEHDAGELVDAAICYLAGHGSVPQGLAALADWPWDAEDFRPGRTGDHLADRERDLVRAGQLIAAELTRIRTVRAGTLPLEG